jgi:hypothetical protein
MLTGPCQPLPGAYQSCQSLPFVPLKNASTSSADWAAAWDACGDPPVTSCWTSR